MIVFEYPEAVKVENGCKVGWLYYDNKEEALEASDTAKKEASFKQDQGFDFGYQMPGEIKEVNGQFKVTVP